MSSTNVDRFFFVEFFIEVSTIPQNYDNRKFEKLKKEDGIFTVTGTGEQRRDFTHVDDVIQGMLQLIVDPGLPSVAHFGKGEPKSISSIAACFDHPVVHTFDRKGEAQRTCCETPYLQCHNDVHKYIKQWLQ